MSEWKFTLPNSKELRQAIEDEAYETILNEIIKGYQWIEQRRDEDCIIDSYIEEIQFDIDCGAFDEETVNSHLEDFYDFCDSRRVWIEIC